MEAKEFASMVLGRLDSDLTAVTDGLSRAELAWRPAHGYNPIGYILLHTARSEDFFVQELMCQQKQVWERKQWYSRFDLPAEERVRHFKPEQVNAFATPDPDLLRDYSAEVRKATLDYVSSLKSEDFNREIKTPRGETTVAGLLSNVINHSSQHLGEASYLRGLQRGANQ
jgi:uncharacterized damage-inducible protein DinB